MVPPDDLPFAYPHPYPQSSPMSSRSSSFTPVKQESPPLSAVSLPGYTQSYHPDFRQDYRTASPFRFGQHPPPTQQFHSPAFTFVAHSASSASPIYRSSSGRPHFSVPHMLDSGALSMPEDYDDGDDLVDLPGPSGSGSSSKGDRVIRRRSSKACDQCRKSKCKCERTSMNEPCKSCVLLGTACTFLGPSRKRGPPKGYIDAIEARLHQTEALVGIMLAANDARAKGILDDLAQDPLAREIIQRVDSSPYGVKGRKGKVPAKQAAKTPPDGESLTSTHPSNDWQDRLSARLSDLARSRGHTLSDSETASPPTSSRPVLSLNTSESEPVTYPDDRRQRRRTSPSPSGSLRSASLPSSEPDVLDEHDREDADDALIGEVGQLSLNEEREVRYHGKASGLHLLGIKDRVDGRNEGGIWRFPKARVWPPLPQEHPSRRLAEPDLASLPMPEPAVQKQLLAAYFTYVHPALPLVHKQTFLEDFRNGHIATGASSQHLDPDSPGGKTSPHGRRRSAIHPMLLFAMFSVAARYTGQPDVAAAAPPSASAMWPAGDAYLDAAKSFIVMPDTPSRSATVATLLIMGYREIGIGAMSQAWLYVGLATRMAQDLGIHKSADRWMHGGNTLFSRVELQERRRIWYACVVMDKYVSVYIGRPLSIHERDFDTELPSVDEPEETEDWAPLEPMHPTAPMPGRVISCFNASAGLSIILSKIVQAIYAVRSGPGRHAESLRLEAELGKWYHELPEHLRFEPAGSPKAGWTLPFVLTLHMQYWCIVLLLHRPFMRYALESRLKGLKDQDDAELQTISQQNYDLCVKAANHITSIVATYREQHCVKRVPVFLSYYVFTASIMHVTTLNTYPDDPQARMGLITCMEVLQEMSVIWPSAGRAWELLHGSKVNLASATRVGAVTMPVTSEERLHKRSADHFMQEDRSAHFFSVPSAMRTQTQVQAQAQPPQVGFSPSPASAQQFYSAYDRWPGESGLGAFAGSMSTSVLPQQYSTGFASLEGGVQPHPASAAGPRGAPAYWNDIGTMSQLGSPFRDVAPQEAGLQLPQQQSALYHLPSDQYQMYGV
ncbi:hypothetical protein FA95DRAFT_1555847 [Auriscalpium vulgare]|uniref:Uncharacterized protein n=1 Tax=Auriscalpium vulgare TaxID=40419 RepID=A0ACB8S1C1_9AGAM|nr:hypothetical protein FA95DRAFT_1555847 [Auriscalpium vulgare]